MTSFALRRHDEVLMFERVSLISCLFCVIKIQACYIIVEFSTVLYERVDRMSISASSLYDNICNQTGKGSQFVIQEQPIIFRWKITYSGERNFFSS